MQICNYYAKGQQNYPATVQKVLGLLTAWEEEKDPIHGSNEGLSFANAVNDNNGDGDATVNGGTQESFGRATRVCAPETHR